MQPTEKLGMGLAILLTLLTGSFNTSVAPTHYREAQAEEVEANASGSIGEPENGDTRQLILQMCKDWKVNCELSVDLARWESIDFNEKAYNEKSGASGVYQFLARYPSSTWNTSCSGDVFRAEDNIRCFMEFISKDKKNIKHWWADIIIARKLWESGYIACTDFATRTCWPIFR